MSAPPEAPGAPITDYRELVAYLEAGCKPRSDWRIGTEHEKFAYDLKDKRPLAYDGRPGIRMLLEGMQRFGWMPVAEGGKVIALRHEDGGAVIPIFMAYTHAATTSIGLPEQIANNWELDGHKNGERWWFVS